MTTDDKTVEAVEAVARDQVFPMLSGFEWSEEYEQSRESDAAHEIASVAVRAAFEAAKGEWVSMCQGATGTSFGCTQRKGHEGSCMTFSDPNHQPLPVPRPEPEREVVAGLHRVEGYLGLAHYRGERLDAQEMRDAATTLEAARAALAASAVPTGQGQVSADEREALARMIHPNAWSLSDEDFADEGDMTMRGERYALAARGRAQRSSLSVADRILAAGFRRQPEPRVVSWAVDPEQPRDSRPVNTYDIVLADDRSEYIASNLTHALATEIVESHNANLTAQPAPETGSVKVVETVEELEALPNGTVFTERGNVWVKHPDHLERAGTDTIWYLDEVALDFPATVLTPAFAGEQTSATVSRKDFATLVNLFRREYAEPSALEGVMRAMKSVLRAAGLLTEGEEGEGTK